MLKQCKAASLLLLCSLFIPVLSACGTNEPPPPTVRHVTVYYVSGNANIDRALVEMRQNHDYVQLTTRAFATASQLGDVLLSEYESNPDVVLFHGHTGQNGLDVMQLAVEGVFMPLDGFMHDRLDFDWYGFFPGALEAGLVNGDQIFMPATFRFPVVTYDQNRYPGYGTVMALDDLLDMVRYDSEAFTPADLRAALLVWPLWPTNWPVEVSILAQIMRLYGMEFIDNHLGSTDVDIDLMRSLTTLARFVTEEDEKTHELSPLLDNQNIWHLASRASFKWFDGINVPYHILDFHLAQPEPDEDVEIIFSALSAHRHIVGWIEVFGALTTYAAGNADAFLVLNTLVNIQLSTSHMNLFGMSVREDIFEYNVEDIISRERCARTGRAFEMSETNQQKLSNLHYYIRGFFIPNPRFERLVDEAFAPYFAGDLSFEHSFEDLVESLREIY